MKNLYLVLFIIANAAITLFSQAPAINWQKTIGGAKNEYSTVIHPTPGGGYIVGGESKSYIFGDKTEGCNGKYDYWIIKLNTAGNIDWQNTIGGDDDDYLNAVEQTSDGGYIVGGYSISGASGDKTEPNYGGVDMWVLKLDGAGNIIWQNSIGGTGDDYLLEMEQTTDGGYIIASATTSGISGDKTELPNGDYDYWLIKLNSSGIIDWQKAYGGSDYDFITSVEQTNDNGFIVGGYSYSPLSGDKTEESIGFADYWILKLDPFGFIEWQNTIGGDSEDYTTDIHQVSSGGYICTGFSSSASSSDKTENNFIGGLSSLDYWIVKLDDFGFIEWDNTIGGNEDDLSGNCDQTADGGYIIGGNSTSGISGDKTEAHIGTAEVNDIWVVKLNSAGIIEWDKSIGGDETDAMDGIEVDFDEGFIISGYSTSDISGDKTEPSKGMLDYWVIKLFPECTATEELCNGFDDNCNGLIDEGIFETIYIESTGPTTFCQGGSVLLSATYTGATIQWKKNGAIIPGATSATYIATTKGTYICESYSACGTAVSGSIFVNVQPLPAANISAAGSTTFCAGGSVVLNAGGGVGVSYQWYRNGAMIGGATAISYTAYTAGTYKCRVTKNATGCYKFSNIIVVSVPCKEEDIYLDEQNTTIIIYPNPVSYNLMISYPGNSSAVIQISNIAGQMVYSGQLNKEVMNIDVHAFPSGVYFINIKNATGEFVKKFIKE